MRGTLLSQILVTAMVADDDAGVIVVQVLNTGTGEMLADQRFSNPMITAEEAMSYMVQECLPFRWQNP